MSVKLFNTISVILCIGAGVAVVLLTVGLGKPERAIKADNFSATERCSPNIRVKIGDHIFSTPRRFGAVLRGGLQNTCDGHIVEDTAVSYFPPEFLGKSGGMETDIGLEGFAIEITVGALPSSNMDVDTFTRFNVPGEIAKQGRSLSSLPLEDGFYTLQYGPVQYFFIASTDDMRTPSGNPVTFNCTKMHALREPLRCGTSIYWKNNITIGMGSFTTTHVPKSEWRDFYHRFVAYMDSIETPVTK